MSARAAADRWVWLALVFTFRLLMGAASALDGLVKLHVIPNHGSTDFQASPLGVCSALLELVLGVTLVLGFRTRIAAATSLLHLALGIGRGCSATGMEFSNIGLLFVLLGGSGGWSLDAWLLARRETQR
jgi:uncharacterized membrane protein YphA (DoxX/SURF4 family)